MREKAQDAKRGGVVIMRTKAGAGGEPVGGRRE